MKARFSWAIIYALAVCLMATTADAKYPERPVRFIVPTAASGATDFVARVLADRLSKQWGQSVVVENRAGGSGLIGVEMLAEATPDGYTLCVMGVTHMLAAERSGQVSFKSGANFTPIAFPGSIEMVLVANTTGTPKSLQEFVEQARDHPGEINYANSGIGGAPHLAMETFAKEANLQMTSIPYNGLAAALPDLLSGRVPYSMAVLPPILGHIKDGKLRVLATTGAERSPIVPDAPTFTEAGYPKANMAAWYGVFGPKGLPDELVAQLNQDINAVVQAPDVAEQFAAQGIVITGTMTPPQMPAYMDGEVSRWMEALKAAGITD